LFFIFLNGNALVHPKLNDALPEAPKAFAMSDEQLVAFAGDYQIQANFVLIAHHEANRYVTQATGQGAVGIISISADTFAAPDVGGQLKFEKDADGKATQLILTQGGLNMPAKKLSKRRV
jgi:hypothetical protein